jgi:hypothetical protein
MPSNLRQIRVARPSVHDRVTVKYDLRCHREIQEYFSPPGLYVTYDIDISEVPEALLLIPLLATLAPVAWALGADVSVPSLDCRFREALCRLKQALQLLHPGIDWRGEIHADDVIDCRALYRGHGRAICFSGGVDSLASLVAHRDDQPRPRLMTVWGADVGLGQPEHWQQVVSSNRALAMRSAMELSLIETNFRTCFNFYKLKGRFLDHFANWYSGVQQGAGLLGLSAPLAFVYNLGHIHIPASYTADFAQPWGSHPDLDNALAWGTTDAVHDGYDLSRQQKLRVLARYIRDQDPFVPIRVCWAHGRNCSRCEKCCRTMVGLVLEGVDPNDHGFRFSTETLSSIRRQIEQGSFMLSELSLWMWTDIQQYDPAGARALRIQGFDGFFAWLQGVSLERCKAREERSLRRVTQRLLLERPEPAGRIIRKLLRHPFP